MSQIFNSIEFSIILLLSLNFERIYSQSCSSILNPQNLKDCQSNTDNSICCFAVPQLNYPKLCLNIPSNSFLTTPQQYSMVNNLNYSITCPTVSNKLKCLNYNNPKNYTECGAFSEVLNLCCLFTPSFSIINNSCLWTSDVTGSYGIDTPDTVVSDIDAQFALSSIASLNFSSIIKLNRYSVSVNFPGTKTCFGLATRAQQLCNSNKTNCSYSNTNDSICCSMKSKTDEKFNYCVWQKNLSYLIVEPKSPNTFKFDSNDYNMSCKNKFSGSFILKVLRYPLILIFISLLI